MSALEDWADQEGQRLSPEYAGSLYERIGVGSVEELGMCDPGCHQGSHTETCQGYDLVYPEES